MHRLPPVVLFFALLAAGVAAQTPSFDCAKASTAQEKAICASPELSKADGQMDAAYKAWLAAAPADWKKAIVESQRLWVRQQRESCKAGDKDSPLAKCLLGMEQMRTKELLGRVERRGGVLFVWHPFTKISQDSADVAQQEREDGRPDYGTVTAAWPQAQSTAPEWVAWNKAIEAEARITSPMDDAKKRIDISQADYSDSDFDVAVTLTTVADNLVSASFTRFFYGHGAAHPLTSTSEFNWLLKEKRALKAADVFNPGIYWSKYLYERVDKYLHEKLDSDGQSYESFAQPGEMKKAVQALAADPERWRIDSKGITIAFQQYEVGCYACTPEPVTMSWESLKPMLNPGFVVPR